MQYKHVSKASIRSAIVPHSWFILNLILTHLFAIKIILELRLEPIFGLVIPLASMSILGVLWLVAQNKQKTADWFIAAHWQLMLKRAKILIISYGIGIAIGFIAWLILPELKGQTGNLVPYFLGGIIIFFGLLISFVLTSAGIFDAQRSLVPTSVVNSFPATETWLAEHPALEIDDDANAIAINNEETTEVAKQSTDAPADKQA